VALSEDVKKMFYVDDYNVAQLHKKHAEQLQEEREYAAAQYHRDNFLYHLPTQGFA
jgi:hypothetical protein